MPSPTVLLALALGLALLGDAVLWKSYIGAEKSLAASEQKFKSFAAQVKADGDEAKKKAQDQQEKDAKAKKEADDAHAKQVADLHDAVERMRRERDRARGGNVPSAPTGSPRPDLACFDRTALESTLGGLLARLRGLADEGTAATVDLDTAKKWAQRAP